MDLSKFKKISSDSKTTVLEHEKGHKIEIAHNAISAGIKSQLDKMPMHLCDGGEPQKMAYGGGPGYETKPEDEQPPQNPQDQIDSIKAPWSQNVPAVPEPAKEAVKGPDLTEQQKKYNEVIDNMYQARDPILYPPDKIKAMKFQSAGEEPSTGLDYGVMQGALSKLSDEKESESNKADWTALENQKKNQLRQGFGMTPLPGPSGLGSDRAQPISDDISQAPQDQSQQQSPIPNMSDAQMSAIQMGVQGIQQAQKADSQFGAMQKIAAEANLKALNDIDTNFQSGLKTKQGEIDNILKEVASNKIDPKHYMENLSAPKKVATAIGLILGGMGGGLMHQENPALKMLNSQIDRDVKAQQDNQENRLSIAGHYSQQLGNMQAGAAFAKATQMAIYAAQINKAAGQTADPLAKGRAQQAIAQLYQQGIPYLRQAQTYSMLYGKEGNNMPTEQKLLLMKNSGMIDDKQYEAGNKEQEKVGEVSDLKNAWENSFKDLSSRALAGTLSFRDRQSAIDAIAGRIMRLGEGRVTPEMANKQAHALLPVGGEADATRANKHQRGQMYFDAMVQAPTLTGLGIGPKKMRQINFRPKGQ